MISHSNQNKGDVRSKTRSLDQIPLKPCSPSGGQSFASIFMKLYQNVCWMISQSNSNKGDFRSKTRSLDQISLKPCSPSRGHNFASIFMKLHQNVCLDDILVKFEYGSCWIKIRSDLFKTLFIL